MHSAEYYPPTEPLCKYGYHPQAKDEHAAILVRLSDDGKIARSGDKRPSDRRGEDREKSRD